MKPYTTFPLVYDYLLKHVDYEQWYNYLRALISMYADKPERLLELGCGTGKFGAKFSRDNFQIYGMDISIEMLNMARLRAFNNFHIFCADMRNFSLSKKFDFIFSVHDTINYFIEPNELSKVFNCVKNVMDRSSIFMFDITTEYNIKKYFFNNKTIYNQKGIEIEWLNRYDQENKYIYSYLKFKRQDKTELEKHVQKIYTVDEIIHLLHKEGFEILNIFSDYTFNSVRDDTVMINFVTKIKVL